jgi:hypothetical protein
MFEIMALRLRENKNINGIKVKIDDKAHIIKISQLADDTTLFVSSKTDIALAMNEIEILLLIYHCLYSLKQIRQFFFQIYLNTSLV